MKISDQLIVKSFFWISFLPIFGFFVAVTKFATPIEVQESVKLIDRNQFPEALVRLDRFIDNGNPADHFALAYRAVVYGKLGNTSQARTELYSAANHKWTFGNGGKFRLLPVDINELRCDELVNMLRVEDRYKSYLLNILCSDPAVLTNR